MCGKGSDAEAGLGLGITRRRVREDGRGGSGEGVQVVSAVLVVCRVAQGDFGEGDVRAVEGGAEGGVAVEEVLEVEDGGVAHRRGSEVLEELGVRGVQGLQGVALVLDEGPGVAELGELVHGAGEQVGGGGEDLVAVGGLVVGAVDVHGAGAADAVAYEGGPFGGACLAAEFDELGDGVGVQEAEVRGFDLPALVLACAGELGEVDGQEGPVDEDVDEVVDELGEDEDRAVGLVEEGGCGGEDVVGARRPDIEVLSDLGQV
ncbi:hypothetical protein V498_09557 [Pseudogymnoascus sp. VKM F-4517 (FW-2822)]|nr:hypothetical protein V498_09557 [Pseudogymnoascus sp. VKM F-4517 (FW-2822)]